MLGFLKSNQIDFKHLKYSDHHHFSTSEINEIEKEFKNLNSEKKLILTTEKDYTRLKNSIKELNYLEIETQFLERKNDFDSMIKSHIKQNR